MALLQLTWTAGFAARLSVPLGPFTVTFCPVNLHPDPIGHRDRKACRCVTYALGLASPVPRDEPAHAGWAPRGPSVLHT